MNDAITIALITTLASIISVGITQGIAYWVNKRKLPPEIKKIDSESRLNNGNLTEKYQQIAVKQADENIELSAYLKKEREENEKLLKALDSLRSEIKTMEARHDEEINDLKISFKAQQIENERWKDWAKRLVLQLESWNIKPVPFDVEEAKKTGSPLGEIGSYIRK